MYIYLQMKSATAQQNMSLMRAALMCVFVLFLSTAPAHALTQRVANTTLSMPSAPDSSGVAYTTENAFPGAFFALPVEIDVPPGETNRLFVVGNAGHITVITNLATSTDETLFMDLSSKLFNTNDIDEDALVGMAFHPNYASNREFYVFYGANSNTACSSCTGRHTVVSRFYTSPTNENMGMLTSEVPLIVQYRQQFNHGGGELEFGPDGYLYISIGDEGGQNDQYDNSQQIDKDFYCAILRIDVDNLPSSIAPNAHPASMGNYSIPPDNPFIGVTNFNGSGVNSNDVRTEFFATGFRNPWVMDFDVNGDLYVADVGQDNWEEVNLVTNSGNYGWAHRDGFVGGPKVGETPAPSPDYTDPLAVYAHSAQGTNEGCSVTGGFVYRGDRLPELVGAYIFGDFCEGNIWAIRHDGMSATEFPHLMTYTPFRLTYIAEDPRNGDVLLCDYGGNSISRLVRNTSSNTMPQTLDDTGAFSDLANLTPNTGIVPYDINLPFWSDNAIKTRWFSLPSTNLQMGFTENHWSFPTSMVWIKHFDFLMTNGDVTSAKRLETRFIVRYTDTVYGVTYRWGDSTTNAVLVPNGVSVDEPLVLDDGFGNLSTQIWHYPSQAECLQCHRADGPGPLGFNTPQINKNHHFVSCGITTNQIQAFSNAGYFSNSVASVHTLRALAQPTNEQYSLTYRAKSYLQANCAQCHFPGGVSTDWDAQLFTRLSQAQIVNGELNDNLGYVSNAVIKPGVHSNSVMLIRIADRGNAAMPPLGSSIVDTQGIALIAAWITDLAGYQSYAEWQLTHFASTNSPDSDPRADPDMDGADNESEWLAGTNPTSDVPDGVGFSGVIFSNGLPEVVFDRTANVGYDLQYTTNLLMSNAWHSVPTPENMPLFASSNFSDMVTDTDTNDSGKIYRMRLIEP